MNTTTFIILLGKISNWLKSLVMYFVVKVDDAHFWAEQLFFKVFMLHERLSAGDSTFSSIYTIVMKALIPSYPEVLSDASEESFDNLYHVVVPVEESIDSNQGTDMLPLHIRMVNQVSNKVGSLVFAPIKAAFVNFKNGLQLFQKQINGQLEFYKENFK